MLEEHVAYYLQKYLGNFVDGLSKEALKISVWQGDVELKNMQLKPEALNALKLPIRVKAGFLGSIKLKVPWSKLGREPIIVLLDRIFVLAETQTDVGLSSEFEYVKKSKGQRIKEAEIALLDAKYGETDNKAEVNTSWMGSLIRTAIGSLKLSITNIHIRYEDSESNPGHPFAIGLTLKKLAAATVDENGNEKIVSSGPLDHIQKAGELEGLSVYLDSDSELWSQKQAWAHLSPFEWRELFEPHIHIPLGNDNKAIKCCCCYLLQPVGGTASYSKLGNGEVRTAEKEVQKAVFKLQDVTLSFSQAQYRDILKLAEAFSNFRKRLEYVQYRPLTKIKEDPKSWWKYAYRLTIDKIKKTSGRLSWNQIVHFASLRKKYLSLYIRCLQNNPNMLTCDENLEIEKLESDLDVDVAVQWRMLAHTYVDRTRQDERKRRQESKRSWWSSLWGSQTFEESNQPRAFTDEDWQQINQVIGYDEGGENILPGHDSPDMLHTVLEIHMAHNATELLSTNHSNIIRLSANELKCNAKIYSQMKIINFKLGSYQLSSPEGMLAESEALKEAIGGELSLQPLNKNVDWSLFAHASPCYMNYLKSSIDSVLSFFQNPDALSQTIAIETAAVLQATLDDMARNAQQQLNEVLKQKARFLLQLDIAAPKIIIPSEFCPDGKKKSKLLLDLGHLTLQTEETSSVKSDEVLDLYAGFKIDLSDVQVFLVDGTFDWREQYNVSSGTPEKVDIRESRSYLPVLERCGISMALQQIYVRHPLYPTTRLSVRLPSLQLHLSPARYHRLMQILKVFESSSSNDEKNLFLPWAPADIEGEVSVLTWKGIGNREAVWEAQYAALTGPFLYILDSASAFAAKRSLKLFSKHVHQIAPESIGGVPNVIAVCDAGPFNVKMMESISTLVLRFDSNESRETWQARIKGAIYHSSSPASLDGSIASPNGKGLEKEKFVESYHSLYAAEKEIFFLTGALDELKVVMSCGPSGSQRRSKEQLLLVTEKPLLELRASGCKVEFSMQKYDMSIGAMLHSLEIEDRYFSNGSSRQYYLARSNIRESEFMHPKSVEMIHKMQEASEYRQEDTFFDSQEELGEIEEQDLQAKNYSRSSSFFYDVGESTRKEGDSSTERFNVGYPPKLERVPGLLPDLSCSVETLSSNEVQEDFVKAQVILFSLDSPAYRNVDKQIIVSLGTLSFFFIRPTIMSLFNFMDAVTMDVTATTPAKEEFQDTSLSMRKIDNSESSFVHKNSVVKGLLGSGKERILFSLVLNLHHAFFVLNAEDGGRIASLVQEDMRCNIKVFPSSFSIAASLGNLRIVDGNLDAGHPYSFICDTRNPESRSFIELELCSFNKDDDDYRGYEYSLAGELSEIRFVYLNRFIQEISSYFMDLVPQSPGHIVKMTDKVTDVEKYFTQSEVEGSPAIQLDISLTKPILIMPRETRSIDFLELDVLHVKVTNDVRWTRGREEDPAAVRLDTTILHIDDIHLTVGIDGVAGEGIIRKANGLSLIVTRSLRDLWHQVPVVDALIRIEELKADLSEKEYKLITECAVSNMSEKANLPPSLSFIDSDEVTNYEMPIVNTQQGGADNGSKQQNILSSSNLTDAVWTTIMVTAEVNFVELRLYNGISRDEALATTQLNGLWITYQANTIGESDITASLKSLTLKDDREGTDPILRYMIGKADDMEYLLENGNSDKDILCSPLTMLVLDAKLSSEIQMVSIRLQQLRLLVAVDFLLAIAEFFVPSLHSTSSDFKHIDEEPKNFDIGIYLDQPIFKQEEKKIIISPKRPLIIDCLSINEYIYDGGHGSICLQNNDGATLTGMPSGPCIFIGSGKHLRFKNVTIQPGEFLDTCILLGTNSSYSILEADNVFLEPFSSTLDIKLMNVVNHTMGHVNEQKNEGPPKESVFDLQAIGLELTFYDSRSHHQISQKIERLVHAKMDALSRFVMKSSDMELEAKLRRVSLDTSSGLNVIEPVDADMKYTLVSGKQDIHVFVSNLFANLSFSVLQLILRLQEDISSFLRITTRQPTVQCYQFDKIWTEESTVHKQKLTFWRARPPPGFAVLGDCVTQSDEPISKGVLAVNMSLGWFRKPIGFEKVWSFQDVGACETCSVWRPISPTGYLSFGCVIMPGVEQPLCSSVVCVMERVVTSSSWMDCVLLRSNGTELCGGFWRVDNSVGSFFFELGVKEPQRDLPLELRSVASNQGFPRVQKIGHWEELGQTETNDENDGELGEILIHSQSSSNKWFEIASEFNFVGESDDSHGCITFWRPLLPPNCAFLGDIAVEGSEPPKEGIILHAQYDGVFIEKPLYFQKQAHIQKHKSSSEIFFWLPIPPVGYASLGCLVTKSSRIDPDLINSFRCVRNDMVVPVHYRGKIGGDIQVNHMNEVISIWSLQTKIGTFIAHKGSDAPPKKFALCLVDLDIDSRQKSIVVNAELKKFSAVIYDDFLGIMTPLLSISLSGVNANALGESHSLQSTVNFSFAAATYNTKCYVWEPLVEPMDAVVRHNYHSTISRMGTTTNSRIRFISVGELNINISVRNLNMFMEAYKSWNLLAKLVEDSKTHMGLRSQSGKPELAALESRQNKSFKVLHRNKLGEDLLLRFVDASDNQKSIALPLGCSISLDLPPPSSVLDPSWKGNIMKSQDKIVTILLGSAKIHLTGGHQRQKYTAVVRLFPLLHSSDRDQLHQQSAHTKCVHPLLDSNSGYQLIQWNEAFIFKLMDGDCLAMMEIRVTETFSGKTMGCCILHIPDDEHSRFDAERKFHSTTAHVIKMKREQLKQLESNQSDGVIGEIYYGVNTLSVNDGDNTVNAKETKKTGGRVPLSIHISYKDKDTWSQIGLSYAAGVTCLALDNDIVAAETIVTDMKKQVTFRSLVVVNNSTDFTLDLALSVDKDSKEIDKNEQTSCARDEILENERYQPLLGWGSTCPGHLLPTDPPHWSKVDGSCSSLEFPEVPLPFGWEWVDDWKIDTVGSSDEQGWSYLLDFSHQDSPAEIRAGSNTFVRRRRWIRTRKCVATHDSTMPLLIGNLEPGESTPLPVRCLRSDDGISYALKFRPDKGNVNGGSNFCWSDTVLCKVHSGKGKHQRESEIRPHALREMDALISSSGGDGPNCISSKHIWFVVDVNAKERDIGSHLQDWQIVVLPPLTMHNYLPVLCEYVVLERYGTGFILREKGVIEPGTEARVYSADIRKSLYLTLIPQGGWQPGKDPSLISHPVNPAAKLISLQNFKTERWLHVLVEDCSDRMEFIAKRIRFYVPCWLSLRNVPPLHCKFSEEMISKRWLSKSKSTIDERIVELTNEELDGPYAMLSCSSLEKMGISLALAEENQACFGASQALKLLSQEDGYLELKAFNETASCYYKVFASLELCPYQSVPTKVLVLRPYFTYSNRVGEVIYLRQSNTDEPKLLNPMDYQVSFPFPATGEFDGIQVSIDGSHWSAPLAIVEETLDVPLWKGHSRFLLRIEVRGYSEDSRFLIVFRRGSVYGPYRLENHLRTAELKYRQKCDGHRWESLGPCATITYAWENPQKEQLLEISLEINDISSSYVLDINKFGKVDLSGHMNPDFCCQVLEVPGNLKLVRFCESNKDLTEESLSIRNNFSWQTEVQSEIKRIGISVINSEVQEILYLSMDGISMKYAASNARKQHRFKFQLCYLQLDNQLPMSILPVMLAPEGKHDLINPVIKISMKILNSNSESLEVYPYIGVQVTRHAWRVNIHEPIIWAVLDFYSDLQLDKISKGPDIGQVDPEVRIDLLSISETRLKLTLETAPRQRPRGMLGIWSPFITALGNTSKMPIHLRAIRRDKRYMHKSTVLPTIIGHLRRDLIHNPLMLLSGLDIIGMTSSTLATLSGTVAELSSDGRFLRLRSKQDRSRRIISMGDGLVQGTEAVAQGVAFGVTGIIRKPLEKAKERGLLGFVQGLGKAAVGVVMEPMSGILDFVSLTANGISASYARWIDVIQQKRSYDRIRLPRYVSLDGILHCYDEKTATGQFILQLAEGRGGFGHGVLFREPSKFAWSDVYEDHFYIPNHNILMITNRRVMLLQRISTVLVPSIIVWDVQWENIMALEIACSRNEHAPIYAVLHLRGDAPNFAYILKSSFNNSEDGIDYTKKILGSISMSWKKHSPTRAALMQKMVGKHQFGTPTMRSAYRAGTSECGESIEAVSDRIPRSLDHMTAGESQTTAKVFHFRKIWTSEGKLDKSCCVDPVFSDGNIITIWQPIVQNGYVSIGDVAHIGRHPPLLSLSFLNEPGMFAHPIGFDLVWRSWKEGFLEPVCIWAPKAPEGYSALGCIATAAFIEPDVKDVWCARDNILEDAQFEDQEIWHTPTAAAWHCFLYPVASQALTFIALRKAEQRTQVKPKKIISR